MRKVVLWTALSIFFIVLIQTAVFSHITIFKFRPEIVLLIISFIAISNGSITGMICGFIGGFILDFLSLAPMGLHAFIFTLQAYIIGKFRGLYNINKFFFPCFLGLSSFLFKVLLLFVLNFIFGNNIHYHIFNIEFLIQLAINTFLTPFVFFILNLFPSAFFVRENTIV